MADRAQVIIEALCLSPRMSAWEAQVESTIRDLCGTIEGLEARLKAEEESAKALGLEESYAEISTFIARRNRRHCPSCVSATDSGDICDAGENQTVDAPCAKWAGR